MMNLKPLEFAVEMAGSRRTVARRACRVSFTRRVATSLRFLMVWFVSQSTDRSWAFRMRAWPSTKWPCRLWTFRRNVVFLTLIENWMMAAMSPTFGW